MATTTDTKKSAQPERPGMTDGVIGEFTVFAPIKSGQAPALRAALERYASEESASEQIREALRDIGTLHMARWVILDDDTRLMFASEFDGSWDTYIDDFGTTQIAGQFEELWSHTEGFPGITDPGIKEWFVARQVPASGFRSSYPDLTTKQILKDQRVNEAFQKEPANAALLATPAFQKLLDEASS